MLDEEFVKLINASAERVNKPVDFTYRLYYNKRTGEPIAYSMEELEGDYVEKTVRLPFEDKAATAEERISSMGLMLTENDGKMIVDMVEFGSPAESAGVDFDWEIKWIVQDADRPMKEWVFVPCLMILLVLALNQKRRARKEQLSA